MLGFLVCKQSLGFVSVVPSTQVLGEEFSLLLMRSECVTLEATPFLFVPLLFQVTETIVTQLFDAHSAVGL